MHITPAGWRQEPVPDPETSMRIGTLARRLLAELTRAKSQTSPTYLLFPEATLQLRRANGPSADAPSLTPPCCAAVPIACGPADGGGTLYCDGASQVLWSAFPVLSAIMASVDVPIATSIVHAQDERDARCPCPPGFCDHILRVLASDGRSPLSWCRQTRAAWLCTRAGLHPDHGHRRRRRRDRGSWLLHRQRREHRRPHAYTDAAPPPPPPPQVTAAATVAATAAAAIRRRCLRHGLRAHLQVPQEDRGSVSRRMSCATVSPNTRKDVHSAQRRVPRQLRARHCCIFRNIGQTAIRQRCYQ